jgi:adenylate cyclase
LTNLYLVLHLRFRNKFQKMGLSYRSGIFLVTIAILISSPGRISAQTNYPDTSLSLNKVYIGVDSVLAPSANERDNEIILNGKLRLSQRNNTILIELTHVDSVDYQYFLNGFDEDWILSQNRNYKEYTNLPAGEYIFMAKGFTPGGSELTLRPFSFRVLPHWYSSKAAIIIYFLFIIMLGWALFEQLKFRFARTQYMLEQVISSRTEELIHEKEKTEKLLTNVLPKNTADELMAKGKAAKIKYNFVTVLFSDIQGFTRIAEEMNPEILIDELDKFFFHFDSVAEKYGIEKIKTIGDAYMCAGGIPEKNRTNPVEVILAALEMQKYMYNLKNTTELGGMKHWDIRIGIHTGTVIAGVVGQKKLSYDIWGDTVNTASRMESSGEAGKINISGTTYEFVKDFFICEYRGKMPVKYKGEIDMYFIDGIIEDLRDEHNEPNRIFMLKMQKIRLQDIEEFVVKMFDEEAPPNLYFHNSARVRTINNQVDLLANAEKLSETEYIHLKLASVFLFTGYITDYENPLETACRMVMEVLPQYKFSKEDVESTCIIIRNSFSGKTESPSDNILHDARYDYMGRIDYINLTDKLVREETEYGKVTDRSAWIREQKTFLIKHEFITGTARLLRGITVEQQIANLEKYSKKIK